MSKKRILMSAHLRGMLVNDLVYVMYHRSSIEDREQYIADFVELVNKEVVSKDDIHN